MPQTIPLSSASSRRRIQSDQIVLFAAAGFLFLFHLFGNAFTSYGYFRDEFYYLACSHHVSWGYVDQPPLCVFILAITRWLLGDSLFAIRLVPALAVSLTIIFTGLSVRRMGGGLVAVGLSSLCIMTAPIFLAMGTYYSMNSLDMFFWSVGVYMLIGIIQQSTSRKWIMLGVLMGIALLNKISFLWFGAGLAVGLLLTPLRVHLTTPWPYVAAGIALLLFSPFIIWNLQHDLAHLEFMQNALKYKYNGITRGDFLSEQLLQENPFSFLVWASGLFFYFLDRQGRQYKATGFLFLITFLILLINGHSKAEYIAPAYPILFAGGGIVLQKVAHIRVWRWVPWAVGAGLVLSLGLAPLVKPLLPVEQYIAYSQALGISAKSNEGKELAELPQFYADMFGWESLAADVSEVYQTLSPEEQQGTKVFAHNYGDAGALEHYSKDYLLPPVISGHNNYFLWGFGQGPIQTIIVVGGNKSDHEESFKEVKQVAVHRARYAMPYENNLPLYLCRGPKVTAGELWPKVKNYN